MQNIARDGGQPEMNLLTEKLMPHFKSMILAEAFAYIGVVEGCDEEGCLDCAQE